VHCRTLQACVVVLAAIVIPRQYAAAQDVVWHALSAAALLLNYHKITKVASVLSGSGVKCVMHVQTSLARRVPPPSTLTLTCHCIASLVNVSWCTGNGSSI